MWSDLENRRFINTIFRLPWPSDLDTYALRNAQEGVWVAGGKFSTTCRVSVDSDLRGGYLSRVSVGVSWPQWLSL